VVVLAGLGPLVPDALRKVLAALVERKGRVAAVAVAGALQMALGQVKPEQEPVLLVQFRERVRGGLSEDGRQGVIADADRVGTHPAHVAADDPPGAFRGPPDEERMVVGRLDRGIAALGDDAVEVFGGVGMHRDVGDTVERAVG
jgi:hypothetical protein